MAIEDIIHRMAADHDYAAKMYAHPKRMLEQADNDLTPAEKEGLLRVLLAQRSTSVKSHTEGEQWYRSPAPDPGAGIIAKHTEGEQWYRSPAPDPGAGIIAKHTEGEQWYRTPEPEVEHGL